MKTTTQHTLVMAVRQALAIGISVSPLLAVPAIAQTHSPPAIVTANDAVKAAAEAAHAAADAAKAAAEAAKVAAEAALAAVEAANGIRSSRRAGLPAASGGGRNEEPLEEISIGNRRAADRTATATAVLGPPSPAATTGSLSAALPDIVAPAMVFTREEIDASGQTLLSEFIRDLAVNTIGSFRQSSGSSAQSQATVNLRGIGDAATVVLINGRRMAGSPTFDGGSVANLNVIPMAAVERIEVLPESASAIYGDGAVGGVVNVVLAESYDGFSVSASLGRPTRAGGDERSLAVTGGVDNGRGQISFALDHAEQEIVFNGDRDYSDVGLSSFGFPGSFFVTGIQDGISLLDSNGDSVSFGTFPDPRCPAGLTDENGQITPDPDSEFPDSVLVGSRCRYNYTGVSANEASLERNSLYINADYDLNDSVTLFGRTIFSKNRSFGRYAPTPQVGGAPFLPTMNASNPNNPTQASFNGGAFNSFTVATTQYETDANGDFVLDADDMRIPILDANGNIVTVDETFTGPFDLSIFYRNVQGGFRDSIVDDTFFDVLGGLRAETDKLGGVSLELVAQHSQQESDKEDRGLAIRSALQNAINDGSFDIFAVNGDTDPAVAQTFVVNGSNKNETSLNTLRASLSFDGLAAGNVSLPVTIGAQNSNESFSQDFDPLQNAGSLDGTAGGVDIDGGRSASGVFGEMALHIGNKASFGYQLRKDNYNLHDSVTSQKWTAGFRVAPGVALRFSHSIGFIAPSLNELFSPGTTSFDGAQDVVRCSMESQHVAGMPNVDPVTGQISSAVSNAAPGGSACIRTQYQNIRGGNEELDLETSESWMAGVILDPSEDLSISLSAYQVQIDNQVGTLPLQVLLADEFLNGGSSQVIRNPNGTINQIFANNQNIASTRTRGATLDMFLGAYHTDALGPGARLNVAYIDQLLRRTSPGGQFLEIERMALPDLRANLDLMWRFNHNMKLSINGNYIGEADFSDQSANFDDWLTWDAQFEVLFPWDGFLSVGARNLFDEDPPLDFVGIDNPFYDNQLHNPYGMVPYIRYRQEL